jgi:hypothetical protein
VCAHLQDPAFFAPNWWAGKRVLELGAGTGIVGMCAAVLIASAETAAADAATTAASATAAADAAGAALTLATGAPRSSSSSSSDSALNSTVTRVEATSDGTRVCLTDIGRHVDLLRRNVALNLADLEDRVTVCDFQWCAYHLGSCRWNSLERITRAVPPSPGQFENLRVVCFSPRLFVFWCA